MPDDHPLPYGAALHAMQTGVGFEMEQRSRPTEPKHLRVGVNTALCDQAGLIRLLVSKGIITEEEYLDAITAEMNAEVERYEKRLSEKTGSNITLR